jgi:heterodisulfide reductase subunit C
MIVLGLKDKVLSSDTIWLCCFCDSCYTVCPQGIKFARIARELQLMAKDEGYVDEGFLEEFRKLDPYLKDVCRRTMLGKVRGGFHGTHKMPCWRKFTVEER